MKVVCIETPLTAHYCPIKKGEIYDAELLYPGIQLDASGRRIDADIKYYLIHHSGKLLKLKKSCFITLEKHIQIKREEKLKQLGI